MKSVTRHYQLYFRWGGGGGGVWWEVEPQVSPAFFREILPFGYRKLNQRISNSLIGCILYRMGKSKLRHRSKAIFLKN